MTETISDNDTAAEELVERLVIWFHANYEDPAENMPWTEGDYVWLVPPRDAREELEEEFPIVPELWIARAVSIIQEEGWEWVKIADLDDMQD